MKRRLFVLAVGLGTLACGSDKAFSPPASIAGTWDGTDGDSFTVVLRDSTLSPFVVGEVAIPVRDGTLHGVMNYATYEAGVFSATFDVPGYGSSSRFRFRCTRTSDTRCEGPVLGSPGVTGYMERR